MRSGVNDLLDDDEADQKINYRSLKDLIVAQVAMEGIDPERIRAYYYDAQPDPVKETEKYKKQEKYFDRIRKTKLYEVRLGRQVKTENRGTNKKGLTFS